MISAMSEVAGDATLTVDELSARVGMTVRTLRFYAGRGLIPPPIRRGRVGYYGPEHIARLDLVRELQAHGFTLQAIEGYLERIPADATPQDIALHRTLLTPWMRDLPETLDREALVRRTGRDLSDDDIEMLVALGVVEPTPDEDVFQVATAHLSLGVELLDLDLPVEALFEGPDDGVRRMVEWAHHGPPHAAVDHVEVTDEAPSGAAGFVVTY